MDYLYSRPCGHLVLYNTDLMGWSILTLDTVNLIQKVIRKHPSIQEKDSRLKVCSLYKITQKSQFTILIGNLINTTNQERCYTYIQPVLLRLYRITPHIFAPLITNCMQLYPKNK